MSLIKVVLDGQSQLEILFSKIRLAYIKLCWMVKVNHKDFFENTISLIKIVLGGQSQLEILFYISFDPKV